MRAAAVRSWKKNSLVCDLLQVHSRKAWLTEAVAYAEPAEKAATVFRNDLDRC